MKGIRVFLVLLGLILILSVATVQALESPWPASIWYNLSDSQYVARPAMDVSSTGELLVAWGSRQDNDVHWTRSLPTGEWYPSSALGAGMTAWSPSVAYSGTTPFIAWVTAGEETTIIPYNTEMSIYEQALGVGDTPRPVVVDLYGVKAEFLPDLEVESDGFHMVFAGTTVQGFQQNDLYYAFRPFGSDTWTPEVVITSTQVITWTQGKIWRPRVAVDGDTIHIVWRQEAVPGGPIRPQNIWYVSGVQSARSVAWGTPQQLSPEDQLLAVRPDIDVDGSGRLHVVWSEMSDTESRPELQYVNYMRWNEGAWEDAFRLDPTTVKLNTTTPTWLSARVAARGDGVAVVWHGFREYSGLEKEEIFIRWSKDGGETWGSFYNASDTPDEVSILPSAVWGYDDWIHFTGVEITGNLGDPNAYDVFYGRGSSNASFVFLPVVLRGY